MSRSFGLQWVGRVAVVASLLIVAVGAFAAPAGSDSWVPKAERTGGTSPDASTGTGRVDLYDRVRNSASDLVVSAMEFLGVPYRRGGTSEETGFDCSGFTRHVFESSIGRLLPRRSRDQALDSDLLVVSRQELKPGDLVFFNTMRQAFSHVGIYMGEGKFIHAPRSGSSVRVDDIRAAYWNQRFNGARRLPELTGSSAWKLPAILSSATAAPLSTSALTSAAPVDMPASANR